MSSIRDPRLGLTTAELQMAVHQQQIALQGSHAGSVSRGRGMGRMSTSSSRAPSAGSSQARLLLDPDSLLALSYQLDSLLMDIQRRIDYVGYTLTFRSEALTQPIYGPSHCISSLISTSRDALRSYLNVDYA